MTTTDTQAKRLLTIVLSWAVTLAVPLALIGLALRVVLLPAFLQLEYHAPGFPPDTYGFTTQERIHWATLAWNYVVNSSDISYLGNLKFDDGSPLYNQRELSHMHDVKGVIQGAFAAWYISLAALLVLGLLAWRAQQSAKYRRGLSRGGLGRRSRGRARGEGRRAAADGGQPEEFTTGKLG